MTALTRTGDRTTPAGVDTRLPWWALALPVAAFTVLLLLVTGPGETAAAGGDGGMGQLLQRIGQTLAL
ncbi:hypothetical protein SNE510_51510 [Streptomyces sp. NE5-10]|uniref:hypothetical protein n=1 Tax=Streptomyces sp. NE5-10 TaxID=2759674 RepID=UPI001903F5A1|nr:hypothetical protein [Streptomyces sp. NE5-10]GHJ95632.1 hypothetical protein SNE510_51510 [Streptomyces sp. NE5-10]